MYSLNSATMTCEQIMVAFLSFIGRGTEVFIEVLYRNRWCENPWTLVRGMKRRPIAFALFFNISVWGFRRWLRLWWRWNIHPTRMCAHASRCDVDMMRGFPICGMWWTLSKCARSRLDGWLVEFRSCNECGLCRSSCMGLRRGPVWRSRLKAVWHPWSSLGRWVFSFGIWWQGWSGSVTGISNGSHIHSDCSCWSHHLSDIAYVLHITRHE